MSLLANDPGELSFFRTIEKDAVILPFRRPVKETPSHSPEDLTRFGSLTKWTIAYLNYVYQNGDNNGRSMPRESSSIKWSLPLGETATLSAEAKGQSSNTYRQIFDSEYRDQLIKSGVNFVIQHTDGQGGEERLELALDTYGVTEGSYFAYGGPDIEETDVVFRGIMSAHREGVSRRGSELFGMFREGVIKPGTGIKMQGVWNSNLTALPPPELRPLPGFIIPD